MTGVARTPNLLTESLGFDSFSPLTLAVAKTMWGAGYRWVGRYLENLTASEVSMLQALGFGILLITEAVVIPLNGAVGTATGSEAVSLAQNLSAPQDVHLWVDDEAAQGTLTNVTAYLTNKSAAIIAGSYRAGLYVGANQPLSGVQLYDVEDMTSYWKGGSMDLPEPSCDFAVWQIPPLDRAPPPLNGFKIDVDIIGVDNEGRSPMLWFPN